MSRSSSPDSVHSTCPPALLESHPRPVLTSSSSYPPPDLTSCMMEFRRRSLNLRRPVLNEISRSSGSSDQSTEFILVEDDAFVNNDRNISNNQSTNHSMRILPEEEIIQTRGRKKIKCSPFLRDLSPRTLVSIKSPIKNSKNEELLKFLR